MTDWQLDYDTFEPGEEPLREALCTLGNGYFAKLVVRDTIHEFQPGLVLELPCRAEKDGSRPVKP